MPSIRVSVSDFVPKTILEPAVEQPQIQFTRQLWQRTNMSREAEDEAITGPSRGSRVSLGANIQDRDFASTAPPGYSTPRRSTQPRSPTASDSDTSVGPEESPSLLRSAKRRAEQSEDEIRGSHSRESSEGSFQPCLCQSNPKIPRPRNAFILYRQHHNAAVVAQKPGLGNPDISKVIGELWRNESEEEKKRWKKFAEEEKAQHQQKYPAYRYQPKRPRRNSASSDNNQSSWSELRRCSKCGGRAVILPGTPLTPQGYRGRETGSSPTETAKSLARRDSLRLPPPTPSSTAAPSTRYLPMLNNLSLNSPGQRRPLQNYAPPSQPYYPRGYEHHMPDTPDSRRRRFERGQPPHTIGPIRTGPQRVANGPGTPFPFNGTYTLHPSLIAQSTSLSDHARRMSLPRTTELGRGQPARSDLTMAMAPPPRPGAGYSQHRLTTGRPPVAQDLNLTLAPLRTGVSPPRGDVMSAGSSMPSAGPMITTFHEVPKRSLSETVMAMDLLFKVEKLRQVALPLAPDASRGAFVAVEGDDAAAARALADWIAEFLGRDKEIDISVMDGPRLPVESNTTRVDLFQSAMEWNERSREICGVVKSNAASKNKLTAAPPQRSRAQPHVVEEVADQDTNADTSRKSSVESTDGNSMDVDIDTPTTVTSCMKSVLLLRTYLLTATNDYACRVHTTGGYNALAHWQWTAVIWRGIVGADLTIYVKDVDVKEGQDLMAIEILDHSRVMVVKRFKNAEDNADTGAIAGVEAGALRRLGFEVSEWIRGQNRG